MKISKPLLALGFMLGGGLAAAPAMAQPEEREGFEMFGRGERGWFEGRPEVFGEGRRGWFEEREREDRARFERGYQQGRMDERRDRMRREAYRDGERDDGWFGGDGLFD
ncbi:hypothetical protein [Falsiroseomonas tokyonensis]|uniref:Uncharacterized protein n=1 Tax=Falsiroseomonas tokyonensis TaxID=430521 RepID=A0ABV7BR40_9PROT|nr:hypothetical protein [Falsiroseomonas tokyonensis]MBU8536576.1 hypothetical protein [Falsiroseomonas tokyonensis]